MTERVIDAQKMMPVPKPRERLGFLQRNPGLRAPLGLIVPLILLVVLITLINPAFLSGRNLFNVYRQISIFLVLGAGMTIVISGRGIDLSVGSTVALSACVTGLILKANLPALEVPLAIMGGVGVGAVVGVVNGVFVTFFKVPPLITTLGTLTAVRGAAYLVMGPNLVRNFPDSFLWLTRGEIFGLPVAGIIATAIVLACAFILTLTPFGRYILALGGNRSAAIRAGVRVWKYELGSYVLCGALAGFAGVMLASRLNAAQAVLGAMMELHAIAVVVLGGTYLFGGFATLLGTFLGAVFLGVAENGLVLMEVPFYWQQVVIGLALVVAVAIQLYRFRRQGMTTTE